MKNISVLVTVKSNKVEALLDGAKYGVTLNDDNHYTASFRAYIIEEQEANNSFFLQKIETLSFSPEILNIYNWKNIMIKTINIFVLSIGI